jgi:Zn-finger nucleic acid-binding protein
MDERGEKAEPRSCPKCREAPLETPPGRATRVLRCSRCRGSWVPRDEARLEAVAALLDTESTIRPGEMQDGKTGLCPLGHGILIRARVDLDDDPFYLDRCSECAGIWFDKGEWTKVASSHLLENLDLLWDPAWRHRVRAERAEADFAESLKRSVGARAYDLMAELVALLRAEPPRIKSLALAFLREEIDRSPR